MKERVFFEEFESLYYFHGSTQNWSMQGFHFHNQYEIILFLSDGALLEIGDRVYRVMKGDLFFINNREYHRTSGAEGQEYNRYVLMFEPELLEPMTKAFGSQPLARSFRRTICFLATTQNSMFLASPEYMPVAGMPVTPRSSSSITSAASSSGFSVMIKSVCFW